jgi:hypothetical protein
VVHLPLRLQAGILPGAVVKFYFQSGFSFGISISAKLKGTAAFPIDPESALIHVISTHCTLPVRSKSPWI